MVRGVTLVLALVGLGVTGCAARAPAVPPELVSACVTADHVALQVEIARLHTRLNIAASAHARLHMAHFTICRAGHSLKDHEIKGRRQ